MTKVFVSSISRGFEEYRQAAIAAVQLVDGMDPVYFESWPAMADTCQEACLSKVGECDIYVGVLGPTYGRRNQSGMSAVEEEYREARRLRKTIILFVEFGPLDEDQQRSVSSLGEWETAAFRHSFYSPSGLQDEVVRALARELRRTNDSDRLPALNVAVTPVLVERGQEGLIVATPAGDAPLSRSSTQTTHLVLQGAGAFVHPCKLFLTMECIGSHKQGLTVQQLYLNLNRYAPFGDDEVMDIENHTVPQAGGRGHFYVDLVGGFNSLEPHSYGLLRPYWDDEGRHRVPSIVMRDADTIECLLTVLAPVPGKYFASVSADLQFGGSSWRQVLIPDLRVITLDSPQRIRTWHASHAEMEFHTTRDGVDWWPVAIQSLQLAAALGAVECRPFPCQHRQAPALWQGQWPFSPGSPIPIRCWTYFGEAVIGTFDASFQVLGRTKCMGECPLRDGPQAAQASEPLPVVGHRR